MKTLIIGLGNPILSDDGIGVLIAREVERKIEKSGREQPVAVIEAGVGGLRLMELMEGYDRVILIDALEVVADEKPGAIHRLTLEDLRNISPTLHSASAHDTNLITALNAGRQLGMNLPETVVIYAVSVRNVEDFGEKLTPRVAAAIPAATSAILNELNFVEDSHDFS